MLGNDHLLEVVVEEPVRLFSPSVAVDSDFGELKGCQLGLTASRLLGSLPPDFLRESFDLLRLLSLLVEEEGAMHV